MAFSPEPARRSLSASDIDVFFFTHPTSSNPESSISPEVLSAFTILVKDRLVLIPRPSNESLLSTRVVRLIYRTLSPGIDLRTFRQSPLLSKFEVDNSIELVLLPTSARPRPVRLAIFDMDSTLINQEVIDELARTIGKTAEVSAITESAMRGELDFAASLKARVKLLEGVRADVWEGLKDKITFTEGARELCGALKQRGVRMAVLSGGFQPMADWVKAELGLNVAVANHLLTSKPTSEFKYAHLIGELSPDHPIIHAARKRTILESLAHESSVPLSEVLCVGDGANDLEMLNTVGRGGGIAVACRAKPKVQREAPNRLNGASLADLLHLLE